MEAVARAKDELHHARTYKSTGDYTPSCIDERKAVERAEQRLKWAEFKAETVKKWTRSLQHELNEYIGRIAQFNAVLEIDVPKAMAMLERVLTALNDYVVAGAPRPMTDPFLATDGGAASMAMPLDERDKGASPETADTEATARTDAAEPSPVKTSQLHATAAEVPAVNTKARP
jgi:hypothetical protein